MERIFLSDVKKILSVNPMTGFSLAIYDTTDDIDDVEKRVVRFHVFDIINEVFAINFRDEIIHFFSTICAFDKDINYYLNSESCGTDAKIFNYNSYVEQMKRLNSNPLDYLTYISMLFSSTCFYPSYIETNLDGAELVESLDKGLKINPVKMDEYGKYIPSIIGNGGKPI